MNRSRNLIYLSLSCCVTSTIWGGVSFSTPKNTFFAFGLVSSLVSAHRAELVHITPNELTNRVLVDFDSRFCITANVLACMIMR